MEKLSFRPSAGDALAAISSDVFYQMEKLSFRPSAGDALAAISSDVFYQVSAGYLAFWNRVHRGKRSFHHALDDIASRRWWRELQYMFPNP